MNEDLIPIIIDNSKTISIYGSYYPENSKLRLVSLKDCLIRNGWINTNLVCDYPKSHFNFKFTQDENLNNLNRSRYCIEHSDLNLLVYIFNGQHTGVQSELDYIIYNNVTNYLLFVEEKKSKEKKIIAWSSIITGHLKEIGKKFIRFPMKDDKFLCKIANQRIINYFLSTL